MEKNKKTIIIIISIIAGFMCMSCCCCSSVLLLGKNDKTSEKTSTSDVLDTTVVEKTEATTTKETVVTDEIKTENKATTESKTTTEIIQEDTTHEAVVYALKGQELGEYGKKITLNANTDMPVDKYLYKIPAGKYKVTTSESKFYVAFFIVKDEITTEDNPNYPEVLDYVSEQYMLTNTDDDLNGLASKEVEITLGEDESIQIDDKKELLFELIE